MNEKNFYIFSKCTNYINQLSFFGNYKDKYVRSYETKITNYIKESSVLVVRDSCNKVFQLKVIHK